MPRTLVYCVPVLLWCRERERERVLLWCREREREGERVLLWCRERERRREGVAMVYVRIHTKVQQHDGFGHSLLLGPVQLSTCSCIE